MLVRTFPPGFWYNKSKIRQKTRGVGMAKERKMVEFGHQEQDLLKEKGTLLVLDAFDGFDEERLALVLEVA